MANKSRLEVAEPKVKKFLEKTKEVYSKEEIGNILNEKWAIWNMPKSMTVQKLIDYLLKKNILKRIEIVFIDNYETKERFIINDPTIFQIALPLVNNSYLSHTSALYLNNLTTKMPFKICVSSEQSKKIILLGH